jgi:hypothetical protein
MSDHDLDDLSPDDALEETRHRRNPYRYFISRQHLDDDDPLNDGDDDDDERPWHLVIFNDESDNPDTDE